ncbi:MAG: RNA methyltransferase [Candidatus Methylacidiphilales bacterium]
MNYKLKSSELDRPSISNYKISQKNSIYVILDNIRSAQNVGSFFRTCDAFNVEKIFLCGITSTPPNKEILKTALGSTESVDWEYFEKTEDCIALLKTSNCIINSVEQTQNSVKLNDYFEDYSKKIALVFGNEVDGVAQTVIDLSDNTIEIPQFGTKHSLNVSVAAGITLWDITSKMLNDKKVKIK